MFLPKQTLLLLIIIQITLQSPKLTSEEKCECEYSTLHQDWGNPKIKPKNITEICEYVSECCPGKYFTILKLKYCSNIHISIVMIIIIIIILLSFYFLSSTGNDYLANVLGRISEKLKLSQNLAGLTLLALGNQAPDIAVAIVAGEGSNEGFSTALGSLLGGGGLVVGLVCSSVIILGKGVKVYRGNYVRDIGIYIIALFVIVSFGIFTKKIYFWMSWVIFFMYIIYVVVCIIMDQKGKEKMNMENNDMNKSFLGNKDFLVKLYDENQESYVVEETSSDEKAVTDDFDDSNDNRLIPEDMNTSNVLNEKHKPSDYKIGVTYAVAMSGQKPVITLFYVDWCGYCMRFMPKSKTIESIYKKDFNIMMLNAEDPVNARLVGDVKLTGYPTVYIIDPKYNNRVYINNALYGDLGSFRKEIDRYLSIRKKLDSAERCAK